MKYAVFAERFGEIVFAAEPRGMEMPTAVAHVKRPLSLKAMQAGRELFSGASKNTRFRIGDDMAWAAADFDDSAWPDTIDLDEDWSGVFWWRLKAEINSTLWDVPLAVSITEINGAVEIYLDGELLLSSGKVSPKRDEYEHYWVRTPKPFSLTHSAEHTLAVRYAYFPPAQFDWLKSRAKREVWWEFDLAKRAIAKRSDTGSIVLFMSVVAGIYILWACSISYSLPSIVGSRSISTTVSSSSFSASSWLPSSIWKRARRLSTPGCGCSSPLSP